MGSYHVGIAANDRAAFRRAFLRPPASLLLAALLFLINAYVCRGLFGMEYLREMGSIEGAYIGISRYMLAHWHDYSWFPAWYAGIPAQNTYPPLLHWTVALVALLRGISTVRAYHWVTAISYCLGPVTLFALTLRLSGSRRAAFLAGAIYSALSPSVWLMPELIGQAGFWHPQRLTALVYDGEGPHITALTLLPLAILLLDLALERRRVPYFALAAGAFASVAVTNWIGALGLALGVVAYVVARASSMKRLAPDLAFIIFLAVTAYCLASPWIPPSTIAAVESNAKLVGGDFRHTSVELVRWAPAALAILLILKFLMRRAPAELQFAAFFAFLAAFIPLASAWANVLMVPQPDRYHLEMELALALLAGLLLDAGLRGISRRWPGRAALVAMSALLLALVAPVKWYRHFARDNLIRSIDITTTSEWRTAQWLNQHWSGGRVMLPGSSSFWLTAFSDTPEIGGGFDQGLTIPVYQMMKYEIDSSEMGGSHAAEIAILWFKALGVQAVEVSGPGSTEVYKEFRHPAEFEGVLQPLWRDRGDVLYSVGGSASLAHVMQASDLVTKTPINGIDLAALRLYVAALENPRYPAASFEWTSLHSAKIQTDLPPNGVVSIQVSWSAGWHAKMNGQPLRVLKDGLGFMYVVPNAPGPASISIDYDGGAEMITARCISGATLALLGIACLWGWAKRH